MKLVVHHKSVLNLFWLSVAAAFALFISAVVFDLRLEVPDSDIHNYIRLYSRFSDYLSGETIAIISFITNELVFHFLYENLSIYFNDPEYALRVISAFVAGTVFYICNKNNRSWWSIVVILLMLHPRLLDFFSSQQRMALALALMLLVWEFAPSRLFIPAVFLLGTIHTYMIVIAISLLAFTFAVKRVGRLRRITLITLVVLIAAITTLASPLLLTFIGDRRADIDQTSLGLLYTVMWIITFSSVYYLRPRIYENIFGFLFSIMALSSVLATFAGLYSERYIVLSIVFLCLTRVRFAPNNLIIFLAILLPNIGLSYLYWIRFNI